MKSNCSYLTELSHAVTTHYIFIYEEDNTLHAGTPLEYLISYWITADTNLVSAGKQDNEVKAGICMYTLNVQC